MVQNYAQSPHAAEQCDFNIHSLTHLNSMAWLGELKFSRAMGHDGATQERPVGHRLSITGLNCLTPPNSPEAFIELSIAELLQTAKASQEQEILVSEENNSVQKGKFKLPKLELRKFSGEPKDYLAFWSQFKKIPMDATIAEEDKFQYLLQCLVPDSKAARLVSSFPPTKNNYLKAITQLKERFGRDELLVQIYVRDLLSIVMKNAAGRIKGDLSELYDLLKPLVESCLPENVLRAWERSRSVEDSSPQDSARSLDKLLCFLRNEVQSEEMIKLARTGLGASRVSHPRSHPDEADCSTAAALVNFQDNSGRRNFRCIFCDKPHNSSECFSARKLPLEEKRKLLVQKHACFRCLKTGHVSRSCKYKVKCLSCDKNHYTIMCADKESAKSNDENTVVSSSVLSNQSVNETVYLQTLVLRVEHNGKELKVRTILDSVSQKSYISERVIKVLQLRPKSKQTVVHAKVLLQEAWKLKLKWDDPLPENIQKIFRKWRDEIVYLEKVNIPRYVEINENSELHLFVDACKSSHGACVYIRTVTPLGVKIRLIRAKSRVAPLKTMTIPRLELMACCIGARLVHSVYAALDVPDLKIIAWSDSMVALWWLKNHGDWSVFVANRVNEINSLVPSQFWRHVPGELNPADLLSRGISPRLFSDSFGRVLLGSSNP
ncbi:putative RNA-directed DNA polymerase from transposon X-element [Trichonephila clavipes]|uniref:Putative RNA-directed DNA polymerase from transposon X-element n=1 Tax=Trichonephila clavipes TaxID=2585209 RepID=A0A8X6VF54_TRICX|nr:putative RNA-directed DNA polymerase from transposon X-element [Trichonephila clavipes]